VVAVPVEIRPRPARNHVQGPEGDQVEVLQDLDVLVESSTCSCNAGDDNPW
jgi:hypothetical protein